MVDELLNNENTNEEFEPLSNEECLSITEAVLYAAGHPITYEKLANILHLTKRQVKKAMNKYDAEYGIVVSNKTDFIEKEDDVIFIPPKTFSFL